jgi:hypothetical protein
MVVIAQRDEAEGLQGSIAGGTNRTEHFGHATHLATLYLEGDLNKIALAERLGKPQQTASNRNSLKFRFGALTVFQHDECRNRTTKLNTG